jgi:hypothetical protein
MSLVLSPTTNSSLCKEPLLLQLPLLTLPSLDLVIMQNKWESCFSSTECCSSTCSVMAAIMLHLMVGVLPHLLVGVLPHLFVC